MTSDGRHFLGRGALPSVDPDLMANIVTSACDLALVVSANFTVQSVLTNPQAGLPSKVARWQGTHLADILTPESWAKFSERVATDALDNNCPTVLELTHADEANFQFPVRYSVSRTNDEGAFLLVGRDLRPIAELQQQLVKSQLILERDYEQQRELEARYRVLMELHPSPLIIVSVATGKVVDLNAAAVEMIGAARADLLDAPLAQEFEGRRKGEFLQSLARMMSADPDSEIELVIKRNKQRVTATATMFRAAGDRLLLCRMSLADRGREQVSDIAEMAYRLFLRGIDAVVFIDTEGNVKAANDAFLNMTDTGSVAMVLERSFADFLARGSVDLRVLIDNVKRVGHLRHFATRLNTDYSGQVSVEVSATLLQFRSNTCIALVIRDASVTEATRWPLEVVGNEGLRNVMQLVGYSTLKDIVAETTEIIEKMCIETALELTKNNRVAAAELLSLSRQSLYVKLRKFGLLSKEIG